MPPANTQQPLVPSLLDRLIDDEPDQSSEPLWRGSYRLEDLREHVRRDLEHLLNTRHGRFDLVAHSPELAVSTLTFGLPDFTGIIGGGIENREHLRSVVERAIRDYEPRLTNLVVMVRPPENEFERNIRLTIQAVLWVDPIVELVTFDTTVEASSCTCDVRST